MDEHFNKRVFLGTRSLKADITYTGLAEWRTTRRHVRMYDIVTSHDGARVPKRGEGPS